MSKLVNLGKLIAISGANVNRAIIQRTLCSKKAYLEYDKDPAPLFTDPEVQRLLRAVTQLDLGKVFRKRTVSDNSAEMKFMTSEQLEEEFRKSIDRAYKRLQMPPVVQIKEDNVKVISKDPALTGFSDTDYIFTDITYDVRQSDRKVVVRRTDGTLEYAPMDVTKRMKQMYFPLDGRKIRIPKMFEDEHLKRCLDEQKYEFILDRLTVQYEPYERDFHRISGLVYQHLNESKAFDALRSTRHFGPMAFFYAWHRCIDDLLYDMVQRDYLKNGVELIVLLYKIHNIDSNGVELLKQVESIVERKDPALEEFRKQAKKTTTPSDDIHEEIKTAIGKTSKDFEADEKCLAFIEQYVKQYGLKKVQLELAIQTSKEVNLEKKQLYEGLIKAHGVQKS